MRRTVSVHSARASRPPRPHVPAPRTNSASLPDRPPGRTAFRGRSRNLRDHPVVRMARPVDVRRLHRPVAVDRQRRTGHLIGHDENEIGSEAAGFRARHDSSHLVLDGYCEKRTSRCGTYQSRHGIATFAREATGRARVVAGVTRSSVPRSKRALHGDPTNAVR